MDRDFPNDDLELANPADWVGLEDSRKARTELVEALARAQLTLEQPKKSRTAEIRSEKGSYSYSYADLGDIVAAAMPVLSENGITIEQDLRSDLDAGVVAITTTIRKGWAELRFGPLQLPVAVRTVQGIGSAITYGRRYALAAALGIAAEADDDGQAALPGDPIPGPERAPKPSKPRGKVSERRLKQIDDLAARKGITRQELVDWAGRHGFEALMEIDTPASNELLRMLNDLPDPDDATSTIGAGGTTAAASVDEHPDDAADAEGAGVRSDGAASGEGAGAPADTDGGEA